MPDQADAGDPIGQLEEIARLRDREAATREILQVVSTSRDDEQLVFDAILKNAARLCEAPMAILLLVDSDGAHLIVETSKGSRPGFAKKFNETPLPLDSSIAVSARAVLEKRVIQIDDMAAGHHYAERQPHRVIAVEEEGIRSGIYVPLVLDDVGIGCIVVYRREVKPFEQSHVDLVETFAAQAVIAIENVRQFREVQNRLQREAATREVLEIISRSQDDERPVFDVILGKALHLCGAMSAGLVLGHAGGPPQRLVAHLNSHAEVIEMYDAGLIPMDPERSTAARAIVTGEVIHLKDMGDSPAYHSGIPHVRRMVDDHGVRTNLLVPLIGKEGGIGALILYKQKVAPFSDDEIALVQSFAAQAVIAIENVRQFRELQNRLQREAASREILDAISRSRDDDKPVFEVILSMASKLCEAPIAGLILGTTEDSQFSLAAHTGVSPEIESLFRDNPPTVDPDLNFTSKAVFSGNVIQTPDMSDTELYRSGSREIRIGVEGGIRSCLWVPLLSGSKAIGVIALYRLVVQPFTEEQIALVETFAAQAVIAIENVRQFRELQNRLQREAATREILEVISRHPDDEQPVFDAIIESAARLCDAPFAGLMLRDDADTHLVVATSKTTNSGYVKMLRENPHSLADPNALTVEAVKSMQVRQYPDIEALENYERPSDQLKITWDLERMRTLLYVPLIKGDRAIGTLVLWRQEVKEFDENDIELLKIFAAQAVIAIENVRQFRELQSRLEREAATSGILSVISQSPDDESPVFEAIHEHAGALCDAPFSGLFLIDDSGEHMDLVSHVGANPDYIREADTTWPLADRSAVVRAAVKRAVVHIEDIRETEAYRSGHTETVRAADQEGTRTFLAVPLLRQGEAIGSIGLYRREVRRFTEDEVSLVQTFAAHAVIAIENVRQFRELQTRLEREAATREILSVISQSRDDEKPVFDTILECATRLIGSPFAGMHMLDKASGIVRMVAHVGLQAKTIEAHDFSAPIDEPVIVARAIKECAVMHRPDLTEGSLYAQRHPLRMAMVDVEGARTALVVPLISDGAGVGCIWVFRRELRPYQEDEIALLQSFAAQAVIAIENVRQFRELQTRLEREKATGEVLGVISRSRDDELPVFGTILENAARLCQSPMSDLHLIDEAGQNSICVAHWGDPILHFEVGYQLPLDSQLLVTRSISENRCLQIADLADDDLYREGDPIRVRMVDEEGVRTFLAVPLVRDGRAIGCISMYRREIRAFSDDEISLIETFAAQAVIAIENVRQFRAIQTANSELEARLEREAATRKILEVISTSRDDETPVFDVIIENAKRLCEANMAAFVLGEEGGGPQVMVAHRGATEVTLRLYREGNFPMDPEVSLAAQAIVSRQTLHLHDMGDTDAYRSGHPNFVSLVDQQGIRTNLLVPLVAQGRGIGCLILFRSEVRPYSDDQIALVETFAAQAVIAIQNVRQFKALEASNADLAVSLERQTATAGVLDVISQAQTDVQPVFDTILSHASRLCDVPLAGLLLGTKEDSSTRLAAQIGASSEMVAMFDSDPPPMNPDLAYVAQSIVRAETVHVEDMAESDLYKSGSRFVAVSVEKGGLRSNLLVPLISGGRAIGAIALYRRVVQPFTAEQIALVETFAAQAVIAIENVRQFRAIQEANQELETRLEREKASRQILSVISENRDDEKPVFDVILENATRLCNAQLAFLSMANDERTHLNLEAHWGDSFPGFVAFLRDTPMPLDAGEAETARAVLEGRTIQIEDLRGGALYERGQPHRMTAIEKGGVRTLLIVPLISNGVGLGVLNLWRTEVSPFSDDEIALVEAFAAQAVIAIENVRQFRAIQAANAELQDRLKREQATGDVLSVINRSRSDQQPVFQTILESASRLCDAPLAMFGVVDEARNRMVVDAYLGASAEYIEELNKDGLPLDDPRQAAIRAITTGDPVQILDMREDDLYRAGVRSRTLSVDMEGIRTFLAVPIMAGDRGLGVIVVFRREVRAFEDDQISLLKSFAAQAAIAIENARQFQELQTRLEREEASREILGVISESRNDEQPVFDVILKNAARLCESPTASLLILDEDKQRLVLRSKWGQPLEAFEVDVDGWGLDSDVIPAKAVREGRRIHVEDMAARPDYLQGDEVSVRTVDVEGIRSFLTVPLMKGGKAIGTIDLFRREVRPFEQRHFDLIETFAAQAVIAIENVRQFRAIQSANSELATRLEREEASREILGVISESQEDEQPVFDTILRNAARLCKSPSAWLLLNDTDRKSFHAAAFWGESTKVLKLGEVWPLDRDLILTRTLLDGETLHIEDYRQTEGYLQGHPTYVRLADEEGMRTRLSVPLMLGAVPIGTIVLSRREVRPFDIEDIQLVEAFAAQAVIAIENSRQFRAIQSANSELGTRLEREEATREVLQVISRSRDDENPVFDAILKQARRLCGSPNAFLFLRNEADTHLEIVSHSGARSEFIDIMKAHPQPVDDPNSHSARAVFHNQVVHIEDLTQDQFSDAPTSQRQIAVDVEGMRTLLIVPLVAGDGAIGSILLYRREVSPFADDEIRLVQSFAAQAVIAIENVHQFRALNTRLEHEAATGEILTVISQSRDDDKPVFEIILEKAAHLCKAPHAFLQLRDATDTHLQIVAQNFRTSAFLDLLRSNPIPLHNNPGSVSVLGMNADTPTHYDDISALKGTGLYTEQLGYAIDAEGMRTALTVPLISGGRHIGVIALYKHEVSPFKQDEISLVQLFAEQAVIAIENSRQFRALQSQLQREEATSQILGVISQSRENEQAVFETILQQASRLCEAPLAVLFMGSAQDSHSTLLAHTGATPGLLEMFHNDPPPIDPELTLSGQAVHSGKTIHTLDLADTDLYRAGSHTIVTGVEKGGVRSCLWVPLISGGQAIGSIGLYRKVVRAFTDDQIALVETFAAQAVIAIENVSQLKALVEARDAAEAALADLKKAQERLIQSEKMASLGQLTAGIAHEIKNPLNFVNNFAKLSDELLAELGEILEDQIKSLDEEEREDAEDLFQTVRENLGKINQHGQRADSIIKNMLLHSREGPSERQRRALNPIVEEALNLAYHGARAENSSFNIDMQTGLAADAGEIDCYPQDLMRVFLNLISNGMYAAYKRSLTEDGFAPVISVTTRVNGDRIEVEVRDNGMGIPDDLREKIFTPFFTTKPAGEGTGLGLSLSYDIVVKQHGGDLTVDSAPGQFTVFRTSFPRTLPANVGGEA